MRYRILPVTPFQQNCTLLVDEATAQAVIIDPGGESERLLAAVADEGVTLAAILVTHGHLDHCGGVAALVKKTGLPVYGPHQDDAFWIDALDQQAEMFGFSHAGHFKPTRWLTGGDTVRFGETVLEVLHCPGHTPGHIVFHAPEAKLLQVGDVLFKGAIGRSDFPRGDHETLLASIHQRLFSLPDDVRFIAGHGAMSTLGEEKMNNPFVN